MVLIRRKGWEDMFGAVEHADHRGGLPDIALLYCGTPSSGVASEESIDITYVKRTQIYTTLEASPV